MSAPQVVTQMRSIVEAGGGVVREGEPMSRHTTFGVGGPADVYARVHDRDALRRAMQVAADAGCDASSWAPGRTSWSATAASAAS